MSERDLLKVVAFTIGILDDYELHEPCTALRTALNGFRSGSMQRTALDEALCFAWEAGLQFEAQLCLQREEIQP